MGARPASAPACGASPDNERRRDRSRAHIALRKPQQNGFVESFNGRLREELLKNESRMELGI
jgi:transposase InsO family protein